MQNIKKRKSIFENIEEKYRVTAITAALFEHRLAHVYPDNIRKQLYDVPEHGRMETTTRQ
jgi:hypothetical protein